MRAFTGKRRSAILEELDRNRSVRVTDLSNHLGVSEVSIRRRLHEDLYLNFAGMTDDNQRAVIQAYVFPLVSWIWVGFWVMLVGTLICLVPGKVRLDYARTELLEVAETKTPVEN